MHSTRTPETPETPKLRKLADFLASYNWYVLSGIVLLAVVLGVLNNLRVYEEQRVNWFGGPVVSAEEVVE